MRRLKDATGSCFLGVDSSQWPAVWADALTVIEVQQVLEHNARHKAEVEASKERANQNGRF